MHVGVIFFGVVGQTLAENHDNLPRPTQLTFSYSNWVLGGYGGQPEALSSLRFSLGSLPKRTFDRRRPSKICAMLFMSNLLPSARCRRSLGNEGCLYCIRTNLDLTGLPPSLIVLWFVCSDSRWHDVAEDGYISKLRFCSVVCSRFPTCFFKGLTSEENAKNNVQRQSLDLGSTARTTVLHGLHSIVVVGLSALRSESSADVCMSEGWKA